jgi:serine/threonine-protein kinase RsbT
MALVRNRIELADPSSIRFITLECYWVSIGRPRDSMNELDDIRHLLEQYISPLIARSMLQKALRERNLVAERFRGDDAYKIGPLLQRGMTLFVSEQQREQALRELSELCGRGQPAAGPCQIEITSEDDLGVVRNEARRLCEQLGAGSYTIQKVTTIVSELSRNIVSYASRGTLEIVPITGERRRIILRAADSGPGIPNLDVVLSGRYRSKTGLGRGLLGTKRLADHFDVATGATGTLVVAEVLL